MSCTRDSETRTDDDGQEQINTGEAYHQLHPFRQMLAIMRSQPDLHFVMRLKRIAETGVPKFDFETMLPASGMCLYVNGDARCRAAFEKTLINARSWTSVVRMDQVTSGFTHKWKTLLELYGTAMRENFRDENKLIERLLLIDYKCSPDIHLLRQLFCSCRHYGLLVVWFFNPLTSPFFHNTQRMAEPIKTHPAACIALQS